MTSYEQLIWTALPAGRSGSTLRVSVLMSPRLSWDGNGTKKLSDYMDFRDGSWAHLVTGTTGQGLTFTVNLVRGTTTYSFDSVRVQRTSADPDGQLFGLLFDSWNRPVAKWQDVNWSQFPIRSFPMAGLSDMLDDLQGEVTFDDRPTTNSLLYKGNGSMVGWAMDGQARTNRSATINDYLNGHGYTDNPDVTTPTGKQLALAQLLDFMSPTRNAHQLAEAVQWPTIEFHEMYSMFSSHPNLLRKLGFLFDLEVDTSGVNQVDILGDINLSVVPSMSTVPYPMLVTTHTSPPVKVNITNTAFELKARTNSITTAGLLNLTDWRTMTSEVESESLAHWALASDLQRSDTDGLRTYNSPAKQGIPARHSAGIAVVKPGMAKSFAERMERSWVIQQSVADLNNEALYAEDLTIGFRLDVRKDGADWRTLHARAGTLRPKAESYLNPVSLGDDESYIEHALTDGTGNERRLTETLARWAGWSLAIARPGKFISNDNELSAADNTLPPGINANIEYTAPTAGARLPSLRFGSTYDLRLRITDACGRSRVPAQTDSSLSVTYRRHEPVATADSYAIGTLTRGELVDVMVVRSPGAGAAIPANAPKSQRLLAPARTSVWLAEQHGAFDDANGIPQSTVYAMLATRDRAELDPTTFVRATDQVPYLPDPMSAGIKLRGGPKGAVDYSATASATFTGSWPALNALEVRVAAANANSTAAANGVFDIGIMPGRVADLRLSSLIDAADVPLMDLWGRKGTPGQLANAAAGLWWQLTPDRVIRVIHAVRQPVTAPRFTAPATWLVNRPAGQNAATVTGQVKADQPSTASLTFTGTLLSGIDKGPGTAAPVIKRTDTGQLGVLDVQDPAPGGGEVTLAATARVAMPDTDCRMLTIGATATSRFADFFRTSRKLVLGQLTTNITGAANTPVAPGSVRVTWTVSGVDKTAQEGKDFTVDAALGTINRTGLSTIPMSQVTISWIPGPITLTSSATAVAAQREVAVVLPSSARPDPVSVAWIIPAFQWNASRRPTALRPTVTSQRTGGTLRIYLNRPWWSSGLFEELAIITRPARPGTGIVDQISSAWGRDPVISTSVALPDTRPGLAHFTNKSGFERDVLISEASGVTVDIARYAIGSGQPDGPVSGYDATRDLWWVDVDIDVGNAYRPFVRLGLARYQGNADPAIRLSGITVVDVVQLEPDRVATVNVPVAINQQTVRATVTLSGPSYDVNAAGAGPGRAWLILEKNANPDPDGTSVDWNEFSRVEMNGTYQAGTGTWTATINVPANRPANTVRLVVEQFERWRTDGTTRGNNHPDAEFGLRLVHQDILPI